MRNRFIAKKLTLKLTALIMSGLLLLGYIGKDKIHTLEESQPLQIEAAYQEEKEFFAEIKPRKEKQEAMIQETAGSSSAERGQTVSDAYPSAQEEAQNIQQLPQPEEAQKPAAAQQETDTVRENYVVGYYASWGRNAGVPAASLDGDKLTHINYAFAMIDQNLEIAMANPGIDQQNFVDLRSLKKRYPHLRTLISVGGWGYSALFSEAALNAQNREVFAQSCLDFILKHGFDGVDLDWEFPVSGGIPGNINRIEDKQNFTLLLKAVREKLDAQSAKDGREYLLTIAGGIGQSYLNKIEPAKAAKLVDYIFIMGYDMHGPWDRYADLNAPLYTPTEDSPQYKISVHDGVEAYKNAGVPTSKLVLGMPFYGYHYTTEEGLYGKFTSAESVSFRTICNSFLENRNFTEYWHHEGKVPYLRNEDTLISFDNEDSIYQKAAYAKKSGLAGVGAWELSQDKNGILLDAAYRGLQ